MVVDQVIDDRLVVGRGQVQVVVAALEQVAKGLPRESGTNEGIGHGGGLLDRVNGDRAPFCLPVRDPDCNFLSSFD